MRRAVIDTNVLLEGITRKADAGRVIDAWANRRFVPCVSTALALEYEEFFSASSTGGSTRPFLPHSRPYLAAPSTCLS